MHRIILILLPIALSLGACHEEITPETLAAAEAAKVAEAESIAEAESEKARKEADKKAKGPIHRSYEHPNAPYSNQEKDDLANICEVLVDCRKTRCKQVAKAKASSDYGKLLAEYAHGNTPSRVSRRIAEMVKADNLQSVSPACRQLVAMAL